MKSWLILLIAISVLVGCKTTPRAAPPAPTIVHEAVYLDCGTPPERSHVSYAKLNWLISEDRWCLSGEGFKDLSHNSSTTKAAIAELKAELRYYEKCLQDQNIPSSVPSE